MKSTINFLGLLLFCSGLLLIDSCKCNDPEERACPTCEIHGQYCENFVCKCPDGQEVIGQSCQEIDRLDSNKAYWRSTITNGNCLDSVLCFWSIDTSFGRPGNTTIGGNTNLNFTYMGQDVTKFYQAWDINNASTKLIVNKYIINGTVNCQFPCFSAIIVDGYTNIAQDTLWCHFTIVDCYAPTTTKYGEFDQIFVRY